MPPELYRKPLLTVSHRLRSVKHGGSRENGGAQCLKAKQGGRPGRPLCPLALRLWYPFTGDDNAPRTHDSFYPHRRAGRAPRASRENRGSGTRDGNSRENPRCGAGFQIHGYHGRFCRARQPALSSRGKLRYESAWLATNQPNGCERQTAQTCGKRSWTRIRHRHPCRDSARRSRSARRTKSTERAQWRDRRRFVRHDHRRRRRLLVAQREVDPRLSTGSGPNHWGDDLLATERIVIAIDLAAAHVRNIDRLARCRDRDHVCQAFCFPEERLIWHLHLK
jgi:hypothetical protein